MKLTLPKGKIPPHLLKYFKSIEPKRKDDLMLPHRFYQAMMENGWYGRCDIIWSKPNAMPESVTDRPTRSHEYVFLFSKAERYYYDAAAIAEPSLGLPAPTWEERKAAGEGPRRGYSQNAPSGAKRVGGGITRNARSVWSISTQGLPDEHYAPMPQELAERCIKASSASQACEVCGAPWARVVERMLPSETSDRPQARRALVLFRERGLTDGHLSAIRAVGMADTGKAQVTMTGYGKNRDEVQRLADEAKAALGGYYREFLSAGTETTGWAPTCACPGAVGSSASVVLDPFAGSGTTGRAALALQRQAILIDLGYSELQERRTDGVQVQMVELL